ncbi:expressed unknown protein [Seminavis robusta]|uniref:Uncharacterized protein n=1 Tax=Seminavis robusta TaxID=568900 RepID=A0A9N8EBS9_9STRA|nr:expressed unknown protein [Seminavis robusta]|eukprot:Sro729_g193920.1 n/a (133) ;mRNA; f:46893-47291
MPDLDDGELLVQEVIAENPVEERGIREEWAQHVGWHRTEDVHLRGGDVKEQFPQPGEQREEEVISAREEMLEVNEEETPALLTKSSIGNSIGSRDESLMLATVFVALLLFGGGILVVIRRMQRFQEKKKRSR